MKNTRHEKVAHRVQANLKYRQKLHTYKYIHTEEEEDDMEITKETLESFFQWLKDDGLAPKKSERLWRKTITQRLLNKDKMTLDNYKDFLDDHKQTFESKKSDIRPIINPKTMIGIHFKNALIVQNAVDADSYIHLFFQDGSDMLLHKTVCSDLLKSKPHIS